MMRYVLLLRGINVSGVNKLPMKDLVLLLEKMGCSEIETYIQTGNVCLTMEMQPKELEERLSAAIKEKYGFCPSVMVIDAVEWGNITDQNPYKRHENNPDYAKKMNLTFLKSPLTETQKEKVRALKAEDEEVAITDRVLYCWFCHGMGRSKVANFISGMPIGTTRNWRTVQAIADMISRRL